MIPRENILVCMPSLDRRIDIGCVKGLMQCAPYYERPLFLIGQSNISLARNNLAHDFLKNSTAEWSMWIDSDIMFGTEDWYRLWEGDEEIVTSPYARKMLGEPPALFGLGFTRIHRSVFEKIAALVTDDGQETAQRFYHKGELRINYFPNGANPAGRWLNEDHGFFMLAQMTNVKPRIETGCSLLHVGMMEFGFPDQIPVSMLEYLIKLSQNREAGIADPPARH
jgi:hypothetical protein